VPAGIVDQRLGGLILGNAIEQRPYFRRIVEVRRLEQRQKNLLDRGHEAARGDAAPGRLHRDLGDAHMSAVALQAQQHERRGVFDDVAPAYRALVAQAVGVKRMFGEAHGRGAPVNGA
jgi:hypothetical protein